MYFYCWKKLKKHVLSPKLPPATYDVVSRNHSNWPSLNLSQNVREGWMNSCWKRQVLMFYPLRKNLEKPYRGWHPPQFPPPPLVRPRVTWLTSSTGRLCKVMVAISFLAVIDIFCNKSTLLTTSFPVFSFFSSRKKTFSAAGHMIQTTTCICRSKALVWCGKALAINLF